MNLDTQQFEILQDTNRKLDALIVSVAEMSGQMKSIVGNGQPGRLGQLETDVDELKIAAAESRGSKKVLWGFMGISGLGEFLFHYFFHK